MSEHPHIDAIIHEHNRLRIMAALVALEPGAKVDFSFLRDLLGLTDGNLSAHLRRLEEAGYVTIEKTFVGRRPKTWICVSEKGRIAFGKYVKALEEIVGRKFKGE